MRVGEFASHLAQDGGSLEDFIPRGAGQLAVPIPRGLFESDRSQGRCVFLFDGLDEIVDSYWREVKLPRRRIELYRAAATTLLEKWRQVGLDVRESTSILMAVAFEMHSTSGVGLITRPELERILVALKTDPRRGGRSEMDAERETPAFLKLIGEQSGILYPRGLDDRGFELFGFLHLT